MAKSKSKPTTRRGATNAPSKTTKKKLEVEEEIDTSDQEESDSSEPDQSEQEDEEISDQEEGSGDEEHDDDDDDHDDEEEEDDEDDDDDDEEEEVDDEEDNIDALFKGSRADDDDDDGDEDEEESSDDDDDENRITTGLIKSGGPEQCTFDLRNMTAMNSHQIPTGSLYLKEERVIKVEESSICIPLETNGGTIHYHVNEDLERASAGCSQLIAAIWQLPTEMSDAGPLAALPTYNEIPIPRAMVRFSFFFKTVWISPFGGFGEVFWALRLTLVVCVCVRLKFQPPPPPKAETKWEKFAKAKGIPLNKEKNSRKVWDEDTGTWKFRHGYEKANSTSKEWPIMEVGPNDDPYADPWEKLRDAKKAKTEQNLKNQMKNQERNGELAKGTTNRIMKSREKTFKAGKAGGNADRDNVSLPTGVPVDLKGDAGQVKLRGKASTVAALEAVQRSTASLGKFDKVREGEPERKKVLSKMKKRKYDSATDKKVINSEGHKSMKILDSVINGGGMAKERAIKKGKYASGETAYDYEYNDGLGASSFKKKKGRAGVGKNKKMTKKRAK